MSDVLRVPAGGVDPHAVDTRATPAAGDRDRAAGERLQAEFSPRLTELQEKLYANGQEGDERRVLLVLQGLDTSGKDGTIKHVIGQIDAQGAQVSAFGKPTPEE